MKKDEPESEYKSDSEDLETLYRRNNMWEIGSGILVEKLSKDGDRNAWGMGWKDEESGWTRA